MMDTTDASSLSDHGSGDIVASSTTTTVSASLSSSATTSSVRNVDYVLLAEFDIEKGSTVSFQYPGQTGTETNILAELMLPDGAHNRDQDWTVFFLNQTPPERAGFSGAVSPSARDKKVLALPCYLYQYTESSQDWEMVGSDKQAILLEKDTITIRMQDGSTFREIKRGANIQFQQMEALYDAIITDDAALGIRLDSEEDEKTLLGHLAEFTNQSQDDDGEGGKGDSGSQPKAKPFLYVLNLVRTKHIPGVKRGARTKAMAIGTHHQFVHVFKPLLLLALDRFFDSPSDSILKDLYDAVNAMDLSQMPQLTEREKRIIRASEENVGVDNKRYYATKIPFQGVPIPMKIPVAVFNDEVGDFSLIQLINKFANTTVNRENGVMAIFNALLRQQRIVFLGYNRPSGEVANYVLAACSMLCPPLQGFTKRAFPYANLTNVDTVLQFPGFIAGVTNPRFADLDKWWDLLCNVEDGTVRLASHIPPASEPEKYFGLDNDFMAEVMFGVQNHYSEDRIRAKFHDYVQEIVDIAFDDAEFPDDAAKKKVVTSNQRRIDLWKQTESYNTYKVSRAAFLEQRAIKNADVARLVSKLRIRKSIPQSDVLSIYHDFVNSITTDEQLIEFLSYLPENQGGLYPIAVSLFHPSEEVRRATVELFNRIDKLKAGSGFISGMNHFLRLAYERNQSLLEKKSLS